MAFKFQHTSYSAKLIIIGEFLLVSYLLYTLTASVYKSYQIDIHIKNFENENARIEEENLIKSEEFKYYSSEAYIEKIAKQNLSLVNPGEEVIIIPNDVFDNVGGYLGEDGYERENKNYEALSNPSKWWRFFFDIR